MINDERIRKLNEYYTTDCSEDTRLDSRHGQIEFLTTMKYIHKYLKKEDKILEIGAGTGRYSLNFAKEGYNVTAIELINSNIEILKSKITSDMNINVSQGDALDLSKFSDNSFDVTLVLGPLYHLYEEGDVKKAIEEAIRVTKPNGILVFSYLTHDSIIIDWGLMDNHLLDGYPKDFDENFKMTSTPEGIFRAFYIKEFKQMMEKFDIEYLHNIATDGMSRHVKEKLKTISEEEYQVWIKYHLATCERKDLQGYSNHMLYICRKKEDEEDVL